MDAFVIVIAVALGATAVLAWLSRNKLGQQLTEARQAVVAARAEVAAARKEAERRSQDKKGRGEELAGSREKLRDARKRLNESQEEARRASELAQARAEEMRLLDQQVSLMREEAAAMSDQLRRLQAEREHPKAARREEPVVREAPAPAVVAAPVPMAPAAVDARLEQMSREVEGHKARMQTAERRASDAERQAAEFRIQADEAKEEVRKARGRAEANNRVYLVTRGEAEVWKARYGTLEQKWNELWRELEGIGWKGRTTKDLAPPAGGRSPGAGAGRPARKGGRDKPGRNGIVQAGAQSSGRAVAEALEGSQGIVTAASAVATDAVPGGGWQESSETAGSSETSGEAIDTLPHAAETDSSSSQASADGGEQVQRDEASLGGSSDGSSEEESGSVAAVDEEAGTPEKEAAAGAAGELSPEPIAASPVDGEATERS